MPCFALACRAHRVAFFYSLPQADGLKQVFTGGRASTRLEQSIEAALQHKDEYGRVLAPKEAFRRQCHQFHGIFPSKSTQEKRRRQVAQEMEKRRRATGTQEGSAVEQLQKVRRIVEGDVGAAALHAIVDEQAAHARSIL